MRRVPVELHVIYIAPPCASKAGALADVIAASLTLSWQPPVGATCTR